MYGCTYVYTAINISTYLHGIDIKDAEYKLNTTPTTTTKGNLTNVFAVLALTLVFLPKCRGSYKAKQRVRVCLLLALWANERVCERENDDVIAVSADIVVAVDFQVKILTRLKRWFNIKEFCFGTSFKSAISVCQTDGRTDTWADWLTGTAIRWLIALRNTWSVLCWSLVHSFPLKKTPLNFE